MSIGSGAERMETSDWRAVLDVLDLAIIVASGAGMVREFNAAAERLTGYRAADVIGCKRLEGFMARAIWSLGRAHHR